VQALTNAFLNDLYGGDLDMSLMVSDAAERHQAQARMKLLAA
jgi:hypothetical protein